MATFVKDFAELIVQFLHLFRFWYVCAQWERGVVFRFGRERKQLSVGWNWVWPFHIDRILTEVTFVRPAILQSQSLTTADDIGVIITPIVKFRVENARKLIVETGGTEDAVISSVAGVIADAVVEAEWGELTTPEFREGVLEAASELGAEYGIAVVDITWKDLVRTRTYRLIQENTHQ